MSYCSHGDQQFQILGPLVLHPIVTFRVPELVEMRASALSRSEISTLIMSLQE